MKNFILLVLITTSLSSSAQWTTSGSNINSTNTGNVGIGTTTPIYKLHVVGFDNNFKARFQGGDGYIDIGPANSGWAHIYTDRPAFIFNQPVYTFGTFSSYNNDLVLQTVGTTRLTVNQISGNVGIGTTNPSASARLHLFHPSSSTYLNIDKPGTAYEGGIQFSNNGSPMFVMWSDNDGTDALRIEAVGLTGENDAAPRMQFPKLNKNIYMAESGGNVGVGTNNPIHKFQVSGGAIGLDDDQPLRGGGRWLISGNQTAVTVGTANPGINLRLFAGANDPRIFVEATTGNVGVGSLSPNQKLTVNGTIYGKEVKVDLNVPGPDYVFEEDYKLPSLDEVKSYVDQHKHLPEVPSAKEMEQNGINLSEMNMILLKKVEELTLHAVNQERTLSSMKAIIEELQTRNDLLMAVVEELKKDIDDLKSKK